MDDVPLSFRATRLAPSPTGALHLGHARTFLITWWLARQAGAKIYMRMEDLDPGRAKPESVQQAYDDLRWLGMDWDPWPADTPLSPPPAATESGIIIQSHRLSRYEQILQSLWQRGAVYPCTCTRAEIAASVAASASAPHEGEANIRYPGTCRALYTPQSAAPENHRDLARQIASQSGKNVCWRLRVRPGDIAFEDLLAGRPAYDVDAEVGDFPITRFASPDGPINPAYQLACITDDHDMGIDLVLRGDDLLSSTPRQMLIYEAVGWSAPRFGHIPLVVGADGKRLAKRHGESRIAQFRAAGLHPQRVAGWAAWRSGQSATPREMEAHDLLGRFDLGKLPRERVILGDQDLSWLR